MNAMPLEGLPLEGLPLEGMTAFSLGGGTSLNSADELEAALRRIGATRYHNLHPFHRLLHGGKLNKGQVQAWALNRYFYQSTIPIKDAVVISRFRDIGTRREWRHRHRVCPNAVGHYLRGKHNGLCFDGSWKLGASAHVKRDIGAHVPNSKHS